MASGAITPIVFHVGCTSLIMAVCSLTPDEVIVGCCWSVWGDTNVRMCITLNGVINHTQKYASSVPSAWLHITGVTGNCRSFSLSAVLEILASKRWQMTSFQINLGFLHFSMNYSSCYLLAARLFCCEAPEKFCGLLNLTRLSIFMRLRVGVGSWYPKILNFCLTFCK